MSCMQNDRLTLGCLDWHCAESPDWQRRESKGALGVASQTGSDQDFVNHWV